MFILRHFFLSCLLLIVGIFCFLTMTTPGLQMDIQILTALSQKKLRIESVDGKLFSNFVLKNITYQDDSQSINIKSVALSWNPLGLFLKKLMIHSIDVDRATIVIPKIKKSSNSSNDNYLGFFKDITFKQAQFKQISIKIADAEIRLNGNVQKNWNLQWQANIPNMATLFADVKGSLITSGNMQGPYLTPDIQATLQGKNLSYADQQINSLNAGINITIKQKINSSLTLSVMGVKLQNYPLKKFDLSITGAITRDNKILALNLTSLIDKRYPISAEFIFPNFSGMNELNKPVTGKISSSIRQLDLLADYIPQIKDPRGILQVIVMIKGTLAKPEMNANLHLTNGQVRIPSLGITPHDINLQGNMTLDKKLNFSGNLRSGKGRADVQGSVDFNNPDYPLTLQAKGSQLQAIDLADYKFIISPDISLKFVKQNLALQGTILIPYAEITPESFSSSITLPNDVVFVGTKNSTELPFTTSLQLTLKLGDKIQLAYNNLTATLGGDVQITQLPGALINAAGELYTKKGVYTAYGQTLTIQTGRLIYTGGSLMNPGLTISAVKQLKAINTGGNVSSFSGTTSLKPVYTGTQSITVGVEVNGTLENPSFSLISTPAMAQGDILSYLVFGFPQSEANGNQYGAILSALSSLNPNTPNAGNFTKNLEQKLGLTEIGVESVQVFNPNATSNSSSVISTTSFVVGKQLSNKLSIHYSMGIFNPISILNLRYQLLKHWAIQSETSTLDNGADVLYSIERD
jgi:autotransporter translocation and assembly factor TamB